MEASGQTDPGRGRQLRGSSGHLSQQSSHRTTQTGKTACQPAWNRPRGPEAGGLHPHPQKPGTRCDPRTWSFRFLFGTQARGFPRRQVIAAFHVRLLLRRQMRGTGRSIATRCSFKLDAGRPESENDGSSPTPEVPCTAQAGQAPDPPFGPLGHWIDPRAWASGHPR